MPAIISTAVIGVLLIVLGAVNMTGNISSLHWYHRHRVRDEDKKPMGRRVGLGCMLCGLSCLFFGVMFFAFERTAIAPLVWVGVAGLLVGMTVGIVLSLLAIIKYNKGLF